MEWTPLSPILFAKVLGGGGGSVTAEAVASAIGDMSSAQGAQALEDLGGEPEKFVVTVTEDSGEYDADKTVAEMYVAYQAGKTVEVLYNNDIYHCVGCTSSPTFDFISIRPFGTTGQVISYLCVDDSDFWELTELPVGLAEISLNGSTQTIIPVNGWTYKCGTLTSLTISNPPSTGSYSIVFTSGSTATSTTIPSTILGLENFAAEANTIYEINVLDNRAVVGSWAVSSA